MRILAVGGGSGGHVTPVVAVLNELAALTPEPLEVRFVCDRSFEQQSRRIMQDASMPVCITVISAGKFRRYRHFRWFNYLEHPSIIAQNIWDIFRIGVGTIQSLWLLWRWRPDAIFAKGGYVCLPVGWAARVLRVPLVIHDSDARPGLTSRLLAPYASAIATGFPTENYSYDSSKTHYVGVPVRADFAQPDENKRRATRASLGILDDEMLVVSFGGGLGSRVINDAMIHAFPLDRTKAVIVAGAEHEDATRLAAVDISTITVYGFVTDEMSGLLNAADIVVCRASATSLQELAGLAKVVIAVPARQLSDQGKNAAVYASANAVVVLSDDDLEAGKLGKTLEDLREQPDARIKLASALRSFAKPNAARDTAQLLIDAVEAKR